MSNEKQPEEVTEITEEVIETPTPEASEKEEQPNEEKTIGELKEPKKEAVDKTVPLATYMGEKKKRQELEKRITDLEAPVDSSSAQDLADEFGVSLDAVSKIAKSVKAEVMGEIEPKIHAIEETRTQAEEAKLLNDLYQVAIDKNPELGKVANKDSILQLAQLDKNQDKTMSQILQDTYGMLYEDNTPRQSMETSRTGAESTPAKVDFDKLSTMSPDKQREVLDNPKTKAEYNSWVEKNISL